MRGCRRASGRRTDPARPRARTDLPVTRSWPPLRRHGGLLLQDLANVEAGIYPLPTDHDGSFLTLLDRSRLFSRTCRKSTAAGRPEQRAKS